MTINQTDFITPLTGNLVVSNGIVRFTVQSNTDLNVDFEGNESFVLLLKAKPDANAKLLYSVPVSLIDTSFIETFTLTNTGLNTIVETSNILFELNTINVSNANALYFYTTGNVSNSSFVEGNTGSFILDSAGYANILLTASPTNVTLEFNLVVSKEPSGTASATSNTITIIRSSDQYIQATGGTIITSGGYRTHVFTTSGNLEIQNIGLPAYNTINYLVVGGGGAGGIAPTPPTSRVSGGGGGGLLTSTFVLTTENIGTRTVTVGAGSNRNPPGVAVRGSPSVLGNPGNPLFITSTGGGGGAWQQAGGPGGSGGGGGWPVATAGTGTPGQGNPGGAGYPTSGGGGGGGRGSAGLSGPPTSPTRGNGGIGLAIPWIPASYGTPGPAPGRWFSGGGGAQGRTGGAGGGGPGEANTGGGGNGHTNNGGSGIVAIRYPYE